MATSSDHQPWQVLGNRELFAAPPFLRLTVERVRLPDGRVVDDFHQVALRDYALVVPRLADGRFLLLRQYKHGVRAAGLHPPGGYLAPGETPLAAAQRELLEETGHSAAIWRALGTFTVDANQGCGRAHVFAAEGVRLTATANHGDLEAMELVCLTPDQLRAALTRGEINVLGAAAALALALLPQPSAER
jgi:ADP-ribose pyrophosphatase